MGLDVDIKPLIERIRNGDRQAFGQVVIFYRGPLFGFLGRLGLNQSHAEEIAQETFLQAWKRLGSYDPHLAAFSTWLFTIARNLALNELSRAANRYEETGGTICLTGFVKARSRLKRWPMRSGSSACRNLCGNCRWLIAASWRWHTSKIWN